MNPDDFSLRTHHVMYPELLNNFGGQLGLLPHPFSRTGPVLAYPAPFLCIIQIAIFSPRNVRVATIFG